MKHTHSNQPAALSIASVNQLAQTAPQQLVERTHQRYQDQLRTVAQAILQRPAQRRVVLLAGPSASGKTTVARDLSQMITELGTPALTVSMDDFYLGHYPLLPDGTENFESFEALDIELFDHCMAQLLGEGKTRLPKFDFVTVTRSMNKEESILPEGGVVVVEGIHTMNPRVSINLPSENLFRLYGHVDSQFVDDKGQTLLTPKNIRLMRRMLRDRNFRNYSIFNTLGRWDHVLSEERESLEPYREFADGFIDSALEYEPAAFRHYLLPILREVGCDSPFYEPISELCEALEQFPQLDTDLIPQDSLFREFAG